MALVTDATKVGPDEARAFLVRDERARRGKSRSGQQQRSLNSGHVRKLALTMQRGDWKLTHQGIAISTNGEVVDGQHRLHAILQAGIPVEMMVTTGADTATFSVVDVGRKRAPSDALSIEGYTNTNALAATLRVLRAYELFRDSKYWHGGELVASNDQILEYAHAHPEAQDLTPLGYAVAKACHATPSAVAGALLIIAQDAPTHLVKEFADALRTGVNLKESSSILVCRNWLLHSRDRSTTERRVSGYSLREAVAVIIKAWNLYVTGKPCSTLRFTGSREEFPTVVSL